jgi:hypothetical protein
MKYLMPSLIFIVGATLNTYNVEHVGIPLCFLSGILFVLAYKGY